MSVAILNYSQNSWYCIGRGGEISGFGQIQSHISNHFITIRGCFTPVYEKCKIYSITLLAITPSPAPQPLYIKKPESKGTLEIKYLRKNLFGSKSCLRRTRWKKNLPHRDLKYLANNKGFISNDDEDEFFCSMVDRRKALDPHHLEYLTRREKNRSTNYSAFHQLLGWTAFLEISNDF